MSEFSLELNLELFSLNALVHVKIRIANNEGPTVVRLHLYCLPGLSCWATSFVFVCATRPGIGLLVMYR